MRTPSYFPDSILRLLRVQKIATLPELFRAVGSDVSVTIFRMLKELGYRSSYSHRGRFYTLDRIARFNEQGLWSHHSVWFSRFGNLLETAEAFVNRSPSGYFVTELEELLHVAVQDSLLHLVRQKRIARELVSGLYLYCSADPATRQDQLRTRREAGQPPSPAGEISAVPVSDEVRAAIVLFYSLLDEKQRRLYAGLEALKLGHGGDRRIAELLGLDPHTVAKGRQQLLSQDVSRDRVREPGGGRKPTEKKPRK